MVRVVSKDLDIAKIADSGQCFRLLSEGGGRWTLYALGRSLAVEAREDGADFLCSREEFDAVWRDYFDLDTDYARFRASIPPEDRYLTEAARFGRGIRILRQDPWETLVTFLISQRKNIPAIRRSVEALCGRCGGPSGAGRPAFPSPARVAALSADDLAACSLGYRCRYVASAAALAADGRLDLSALSALGTPALLEALTAVPGVGPKVASCVALFAYHRLEGFPRDVWINRIIDREYGGCFCPERCEGFQGVAQQYLFYYARSGAPVPAR